MTAPFTKAAVLEILNSPQSWDTFPDMIRRVEALEGCAQCCMCGKTGLSTAEDGGPECELHDGRWVCSSDCWDRAALEPVAQPEPGYMETCGACMGSGYGGHPDSGVLCNECNGSGGVQPETPTPGQFTTMCLAIEDVVTGRGFDVAIPEEVKAYMRNALMVGGWRGERD